MLLITIIFVRSCSHSEQPQILPSPQKKKLKVRKRPRKEKSSNAKSRKQKPVRGFPLSVNPSDDLEQLPTKRNLLHAIDSLDKMKPYAGFSKAIVESTEDSELFVKLLKKPDVTTKETAEKTQDEEKSEHPTSKNIGFVKLSSRKSSNFADARLVIQKELVPDAISAESDWRFFVPGLGPVSSKQEESMGPLFPFLRGSTTDVNLGDGTLSNPVKVFIMEVETGTGTNSSGGRPEEPNDGAKAMEE